MKRCKSVIHSENPIDVIDRGCCDSTGGDPQFPFAVSRTANCTEFVEAMAQMNPLIVEATNKTVGGRLVGKALTIERQDLALLLGGPLLSVPY